MKLIGFDGTAFFAHRPSEDRTTMTDKNQMEGNAVPFVPVPKDDDERGRFLGVIPKKYMKSIPGLIHGLSSIASLLTGSYKVLVDYLLPLVVVGYDEANNVREFVTRAFYFSSFVSGLVTFIYFWEKVQSWQLSTTSAKDKGLTPEMVRRFNQGRGVVAILLYVAYPAVCTAAPDGVLASRVFSCLFSIVLLIGTAILQSLIKDYPQPIFIFAMYCLPHLDLSGAIVSHGSIAALNKAHPRVLSSCEMMATIMITCLQFGFLMYYLFSRGLVPKAVAMKSCKIFHPCMCVIYLIRVLLGQWWKFVPGPILLQTAFFSLTGFYKLFEVLCLKGPTQKTALGVGDIKSRKVKAVSCFLRAKDVDSF